MGSKGLEGGGGLPTRTLPAFMSVQKSRVRPRFGCEEKTQGGDMGTLNLLAAGYVGKCEHESRGQSGVTGILLAVRVRYIGIGVGLPAPIRSRFRSPIP